MNDVESVSVKHYEKLINNKEHHDPNNLVLRTMIERLKTFPNRVNRLIFGLEGYRIDIWHCYCARRYRVSYSSGRFEGGEECSPCNRHKDLFSDLVTINDPSIVTDSEPVKSSRVDGYIAEKADSNSETVQQKTMDCFFG